MKFEKISKKQFENDILQDEYYSSSEYKTVRNILEEDIFPDHLETRRDFYQISISEIYEDIRLPSRATKFSAGYDIYAPYSFSLYPGDTINISTGIRVKLDNDKFLFCCPRSGHGFKYRIQLDNTVGIVDADYYYALNEGHIHVKLTNDGHQNQVLHVNKGDAICQAIIMKYYQVEDDDIESKPDRIGGFGSTTNLGGN